MRSKVFGRVSHALALWCSGNVVGGENKSPSIPLFHGSIFLTMTLSLSNGSREEGGKVLLCAR